MEIILLLIAVSIGLALFFLISFIWANKSGQFEDVEGPAMRMLFDDDSKSITKKSEKCN